MRLDNLILCAIGGAAVLVAVIVSWRGRHLPIVAPPSGPTSARAAAVDSMRSLAAVFAAAIAAGVLVVGVGGRLVMRVLGASSGGPAQGRLTEAGETVGEITFSGTLGFILFVGVLSPVAASFLYLLGRRILPNRAWMAGLVYGAALLATFGVSDPLSPDNIDFRILTPLPVAVALVALTALLFGTTFTAIAARLDAALRRLPTKRPRDLAAYAALVVLLVPIYLVPATIYVAVRTLAHGRLGSLTERRGVQLVGHVLVAVAVVASVLIVTDTATQIL
jgi:hypothetical protein